MAVAVHDWTRVDDATFHDFHNTWLVLLKVALNRGLLPAGYYAQVEQRANQYESDVLALERPVPPANGPTSAPPDPPPAAGAVAVADAPPAAAVHLAAPGRRPRSVAVRHVSGHRVVALIELTSPANKDRAASVAAFVAKVTTALDAGVHVVVLDVLAAGRFDPDGLPGAVWAAVGNGGYQLPAAKRLTCASFVARPSYEVYADHLAPGDPLPATPLFLTAGEYVPLPLGPTYLAAFDSIPEHHRNVLTAAPA